MNGKKRETGRDNPTKRAGPSVHGTRKNKLEILEVENASLYPHICSLIYALTVECTRLTQQDLLDSKISQTVGPG